MPRLTDTQWDAVRADYEINNLSYTELSKAHGISKAAISNRANRDNWRKGKTEQLIDKKVNAFKKLHETEQQTEQLNLTPTETVIFDNAVKERLELEGIFLNAAKYNQMRANKALQSNIDASMQEIESHSRITQRNKETVLGKSPDTQVNIQNNAPERIERVIIDPQNAD